MMLATTLGSPAAAEKPSTEELGQIAAYLSNNNVSALRAYLLDHPELLEDETPLAGLLREFMDESNDITGFRPSMREALGAYTTTQDGPASGSGGASGRNSPPDGILY